MKTTDVWKVSRKVVILTVTNLEIMRVSSVHLASTSMMIIFALKFQMIVQISTLIRNDV